jgi:hypothetical protein
VEDGCKVYEGKLGSGVQVLEIRSQFYTLNPEVIIQSKNYIGEWKSHSMI